MNLVASSTPGLHQFSRRFAPGFLQDLTTPRGPTVPRAWKTDDQGDAAKQRITTTWLPHRFARKKMFRGYETGGQMLMNCGHLMVKW